MPIKKRGRKKLLKPEDDNNEHTEVVENGAGFTAEMKRIANRLKEQKEAKTKTTRAKKQVNNVSSSSSKENAKEENDKPKRGRRVAT